MPAVRYVIKARRRGYTEGFDNSVLLASGKLTSTGSTLSAVITMPTPPNDHDLYLELDSRYVDDVAKTGAGHCYVGIWNADQTPTFTSSNVTSEVPPRFVMAPPTPNTPFQPHMFLTAKPGQKVAILDTGWAV